ncbi:DUF5677 domain-containing protein [Stutzerimonas stutzeri]|uniref:DUF5677 domain-containing protein n=1 Tax=Stutzerimonas stutzeri TaxID=316 RepID=UPI000ACFF639|nr:DUF5677 domain-containing protein [Stutzerimonas stutzeri]
MTPGMEWLNDIQTLSIKLFKQLCSTKSLAYGCVFQSNTGNKIEFIDQGSISILARASIETFLALHWIFQGSAEQSQFRHALWQYAGLADRANLNPSTDEGRIKQADTKVQMAQLLELIEASPFLSLYSIKEIKELKKGNWRVGWSWSSEAVKAGFHKSYFDNVYGHLCGYPHSKYISAMQIGQAQNIADQKQLSSAGVQISIHVMAHFIRFYASTFSPAADLLSSSPAKAIAGMWHFKAEDMIHIFDQKNDAESM